MNAVKPSRLLIAALAAIGLSTAAQAADTITVVSWGGSYTTSQVEAYHKPWIAKTGNQINSEDYNGGLAEIRAQVEAGNVTWDLVDVELADAVRGCDEGILEPLPLDELPAGADGTPAKDDFIAGTLHECAVGEIVWSTVYAYDTTKVAAKPASIADFFDLKKIPGKRGLRKTAKVNLEWALMADGVPADKVYETLATPEGVDQAFAKLDTIQEQGSRAGLHQVLHGHPASCRSGEVHLLRSGPEIFLREGCSGNAAAHADCSGQLQEPAAERLRVLG